MAVKRRTTTGCLTCRKRKKKCDEVKPSCTGCQNNFLECQWPDYSDGRIRKRAKPMPPKTLQFNITEMKLKPRIKYNCPDLKMEVYVKRRSNRLYAYEGDKLKRIKTFPREDIPLTAISDSPFKKYHNDNPLDLELLDSTIPLDLELGDLPFIDLPADFEIPTYELEVPTLQEEERFKDIIRRYKNNELLDDSFFKDIDLEAFIFYSCLKGYIPKLGTQHTSPDLTVGATFIPFVSSNPIMRQVFLCCGATYLAWKDYDRFQKYSDDYYVSSKNLIQEYMITNPLYFNEDWLFASIQLLCNRVKNAFTGTVDDSVILLSYSYQIISHRYFDNHTIQPHERMFVESFIYHYSISILYAKDISKLPSPFIIFKELNKVLKCPVYNCENVVQWMKNPLLGSCLDTFEIIAKLSCIARLPMPLSERWLVTAVQLRNLCIQYRHPDPDPSMTDIEWFNFRINSMVGLLTAKACYLFASKIINYNTFDPHSDQVKECIKEIIQHYKEIPKAHQVWGILSWATLISGVFCTDVEDQDFILQLISQMNETAHTYAGVKMARFLHDVWNDDTNVNHLFDREMLSLVDM